MISFLGNAPHKYSLASVFANDVNDHCVIATVRDTKLPKHKPRIITRRCLRHFNEQGFLFDVAHYDWDRIFLIPDVESAWKYFYDGLISMSLLKNFVLKVGIILGFLKPYLLLFVSMMLLGQKLDKLT